MIVGVPKEVKDSEYRVAVTPEGVRELTRAGHDVVIETSAGVGSALADDRFSAAGATVLGTADAVFEAADMILKVKEPQPQEYARFREGQVLFTYLHLAADKALTEFLIERRVASVAYETVELEDGRLPAPRADERDRRPDGPAGRCVLPDAPLRGSRRADGGRRRRRAGTGRGARGRDGGAERGVDRRRDGGRDRRPRQERRPAPLRRSDPARADPDRDEQRTRDRGGSSPTPIS